MIKKLIALLLLPFAAYALELGSPFSDHMVLQRGKPVPVWGRAEPGATVTVEFAEQKKTTTVDSSNHWEIVLDPMPASSKSRKLQISSFEFQVALTNVLVGEVWYAV